MRSCGAETTHTWITDMPAMTRVDMPGQQLFLGYRGSIAHGMYVPNDDPDSIDDIDLMGVYMGSESYYLGFERKDTHERTFESDRGLYDAVHYEWRKFIHLLVKSNPNVLGMLWLPYDKTHVTSPLWRKLVGNRDVFVSKLAYKTFGGYAHSQLQKMTRARIDPKSNQELQAMEKELRRREEHRNTIPGPFYHEPTKELRRRANELRGYQGYMGPKRRELVERYGYDTKNAAHLVRLLRMGIEFLSSGEMYLDRSKLDADNLLDIKRGEVPLREVQKLSEFLFGELDRAYTYSVLPEEPDREKAESITIEGVKEYYAWD